MQNNNHKSVAKATATSCTACMHTLVTPFRPGHRPQAFIHSFVEATFTVPLVSSRQPQSLQDVLPASAASDDTTLRSSILEEGQPCAVGSAEPARLPRLCAPKVRCQRPAQEGRKRRDQPAKLSHHMRRESQHAVCLWCRLQHNSGCCKRQGSKHFRNEHPSVPAFTTRGCHMKQLHLKRSMEEARRIVIVGRGRSTPNCGTQAAFGACHLSNVHFE